MKKAKDYLDEMENSNIFMHSDYSFSEYADELKKFQE